MSMAASPPGAAGAPSNAPSAPSDATLPQPPTRAADGEDETSMQSFIRSQMLGILHPVAEHIREVQGQVQQLSKALAATDTRVDENKVALDQQHQDLGALRQNLSQTDALVERLQSEAAMTQREKDRLQADHEVTKADLGKTVGNLRTANVLLKALQQKTEDLDGDIRSLQFGAAKMGRTLLEDAEKFAQLKESYEALNGRHLDLVKDVGGLGRANAETDRNLQKHILRYEKGQTAALAEGSRLKEHTNSLEGRLCNTQNELQRQIDNLKSTDTQVRMIKASLDHEEGSSRKMDTIQLSQEQAAQTIKDQTLTIQKLQAAIQLLQTSVMTDKEQADHQFKDLEEKFGTNSSKVEVLNLVQQKHSDQLKKADLCIGRLQKGIDAVGDHAENLHQDLKNQRVLHNDTVQKLEMQRIQLVKTQNDLQHAGSELDSTNKSIFQLKDGLAAMNSSMSKLGSRYDSCNKNIQGMSKGFQDISRHVVQGDHGLLSPRTPNTRRLPDIHPAPGSTGST